MNLQYVTARNVSIDDIDTLQIPPLQRFYDKSPSWSRIALERGRGLTDPLPKKSALRDGKLIQFNSAKLISYLVFDIDEPHSDDTGEHASCFYNWYHANVPAPQFIIRNTKNGHCQYFYELKNPVSTSPKSEPRPQHYLHAIRKQMTLALNADSAYTHALSRNPFNNENQEVFYSLIEPYELAYLDKLDDDEPQQFKPKNPDDWLGLGRNNDLFHTVRYDAYAYKECCSRYEQLYNFCLNECRAVNQRQNRGNLLPDNEVQHTAKSIAVWTWEKYNGRGRHRDKHFSKTQAKRGKKGGKQSQTQYKSQGSYYKRTKAKKLLASGMSKSEIAKSLKVSRVTITKWLKDN